MSRRFGQIHPAWQATLRDGFYPIRKPPIRIMNVPSPSEKKSMPHQAILSGKNSRLGCLLALAVVVIIVIVSLVQVVRYMGCASSDNSALFQAIENNDLQGVQSLLSEGHDPNSTRQCYWIDNDGYRLVTDPQPEPAIVMAAEKDSAPLVSALLAAKADPNALGQSGIPALKQAIMNANYAVVPPLLQAGADPNWIEPNTGETLLMLAVKLNQVKNVQALLAAGAETGTRDAQGNTAIFYAAPDGVVRGLLGK
ncbi:MAG: ankyrin repeat domain-containing protein [Anaerolineales bacterium]